MEKLLQDTIYDAIKRDIERAARAAYLRALDDVKHALDLYWRPTVNDLSPWDIIDQLKSDYAKGSVK